MSSMRLSPCFCTELIRPGVRRNLTSLQIPISSRRRACPKKGDAGSQYTIIPDTDRTRLFRLGTTRRYRVPTFYCGRLKTVLIAISLMRQP
ncbi:hypothetical protein D3C87_1794090 [compost metagenome]